MILRTFKSNQPFIALLFPLLAVVPVWLGHSFNGKVITDLPAFFPEFDAWIASVYWLDMILQWIAISMGALATNRLFNRHDFLSEATHLPGFFFILLLCMWPTDDSRYLWGLLFFILATGKSLNIPLAKRAVAPLFDSGLLIGLASLFHPVFIISGLLLPFSSTIGRKPNLREILLPYIGTAFLIWLFLGSLYLFLPDKLTYITSERMFSVQPLMPPVSALVCGIVTLSFCIPWLNSYAASNNKSRNEKTIFLISSAALLTMAVCAFIISSGNAHLTIAFPGSFLFAFFFQSKSKRNKLKSLFFYVFCAALVLIGHFLT